uniref:Uncharacterized protein n=1 Tax=Romanomermis culicivorax TaxID=13658 RepID=A0A915HML4_ROMCU
MEKFNNRYIMTRIIVHHVILFTIVAILRIVAGCNNNDLDDLSVFYNTMQCELQYKLKNVRQKATCSMPDGSTRTYNKTGIWAGSSYPDCNLNIRFALYT